MFGKTSSHLHFIYMSTIIYALAEKVNIYWIKCLKYSKWISILRALSNCLQIVAFSAMDETLD